MHRGLIITVLVILIAGSALAEPANIGEQRLVLSEEYIDIELSIPLITNCDNWLFQEYLNALMRHQQLQFAVEVSKMAVEQQEYLEHLGSEIKYSANTEFEVMYNQDGVLSIVMLFYEYTGGAHGHTYQQSLNYDLVSEKEIVLTDLQIPHVKQVFLEEINRQIEDHREDFFDDAVPVESLKETDFYLTDKGIVIFYQLYEIAPYAAGIQEFLIQRELFN